MNSKATSFITDARGSPIFSVVVCTRNRLENLRRCFAALKAVKTSWDWELVIVNNGSTDGTQAYLDEIAMGTPYPFGLTTKLDPKPGLARARNTGWRASRGPLIAFTDDDCYVSPDFIDALFQVFEDNPQCGFATGRILLFDHRDQPITIQESEERAEFPPRSFLQAGAVQGANMAFRREALERIGGFDERLGAGTPFPSEDLDAAAAALWAGYSGVYDPRPVVYHDHGRRTADAATALMASYDAGRGAYYAKNVLRSQTRSTYLRAWAGSIKRDVFQSLPQRRLPVQSMRELRSGLRFMTRGG